MTDWQQLSQIEWLPLGTFINVGCILIGGIAGLLLSRQLPDNTQRRIRSYLAGLTMIAGSFMMAQGLYGGWKESASFWIFLLLGLIALLSISFGNLIGTQLKLQERLDQLGQEAKRRLGKSKEDGKEDNRFSDGFVTCTVLFTVGADVHPWLRGGWFGQRAEYFDCEIRDGRYCHAVLRPALWCGCPAFRSAAVGLSGHGHAVGFKPRFHAR